MRNNQTICQFKLPFWDELPEFDLYMDQVISYIRDKLENIYFNNEKIITTSMINNYVKTKIVQSPKKKLYSKEHIAYFIIVTILKRCYTLNEISDFIQLHTQMNNSSISKTYDLFVTCFEKSLHEIIEVGNTLTGLNSVENEQQILMDQVIQCIVYKITTEYYLCKSKNKL